MLSINQSAVDGRSVGHRHHTSVLQEQCSAVQHHSDISNLACRIWEKNKWHTGQGRKESEEVLFFLQR